MLIKNKYAILSKISEAKFRKLIRLFALNLGATQISVLTGLNRKTVNRFLKALRERIAQYCEEQSPLSGEIEVDESFFGSRWVKGKRGRGAFRKTIVFGLFKRNRKVYTEIVPTCSKNTLQAIIRGKVGLESVITSDGWRGFNGLVYVGYGKNLRVDHGKDQLFLVPTISRESKDSGCSPNPGSPVFAA